MPPKSARSSRRVFEPEDKIIESSDIVEFPLEKPRKTKGGAQTAKSRGKRDFGKLSSPPSSDGPKPVKLVKVRNQGDFSGEELEVLPPSQPDTPTAPPSSPASDSGSSTYHLTGVKGRIECDCPGPRPHHHDDDDDDDDDEDTESSSEKHEDDDNKSVSASAVGLNGVDDRKLLTCFYRDVPFKGNMYSFIYIKRLDKRVNFHVERIPYLINKLSYYYSIKGKNHDKMNASLLKSVKLIENAMGELNESDLDIPDGM